MEQKTTPAELQRSPRTKQGHKNSGNTPCGRIKGYSACRRLENRFFECYNLIGQLQYGEPR